MVISAEAHCIFGEDAVAESDYITGSTQERTPQFEINQKKLGSFPRSQNGHNPIP